MATQQQPVARQGRRSYFSLDLFFAFLLSVAKLTWATIVGLFGNFIGFGTFEFATSPNSIQLKLKKASGKENGTTISLRDIVQAVTPPVRLNPLFFNSHVHTLAVGSQIVGRSSRICYKRREWESDSKAYPGHFTTDWVVPAPSPAPPRDKKLPPRTQNFAEEEWQEYLEADMDKPLIIVHHGFLGGSHEHYIRHSLASLTGLDGPDDFAAVVINARGCCYSRVTSPVLYNPRATWDMRQFANWAKKQWPQRRLFAIGFSVGACVLTNYLGEEGDKCPLTAAIVVGNPWNLDLSNNLLSNSFIGLQLYQRALAFAFRQTFIRHLEHLQKDTRINVEQAKRSQYLWQWDEAVQCPSWGYPSRNAYYRDVSSCDAVHGIKIPTLCLGSKDDPVCANLAVPYDLLKVNPYVVLITTSIGGHLGWFEIGGGRWSNRVIDGFLRTIVNDTDGMAPVPDSQLSKEEKVLLGGKSDENVVVFDPVRRKCYWPSAK